MFGFDFALICQDLIWGIEMTAHRLHDLTAGGSEYDDPSAELAKASPVAIAVVNLTSAMNSANERLNATTAAVNAISGWVRNANPVLDYVRANAPKRVQKPPLIIVPGGGSAH